MRVLLISTYELGHQPFSLASAAAWLRRAGFEVASVDASRDAVSDGDIEGASLAALSLPMHTATRLALPLIRRIRATNPGCRICCFGLYAPLNETRLRAEGADAILGPEFEEDLAALARDVAAGTESAVALPTVPGRAVGRVPFIVPDRSLLPSLERYAQLRLGDESRVAGYTEASRGCKHRCRHCPIVPVYNGAFRIVPPGVVLADVRAQVEAGARHITFGDPDFFNAVSHAMPLVRAFAREFPGVTCDVTIKVEHLVQHGDCLPELAASGCLFVTSAVESVDDRVLALLAKGHTRADVERAVALCRAAGLGLSPTFVAFTPWTTIAGYLDLLDIIERLDLVPDVAPIQLALRLLVPNGSLLRELEEVSALLGPFDGDGLVYPWRHPKPSVDSLQSDVMRLVTTGRGAPREELFERVRDMALRYAREEEAIRPKRGDTTSVERATTSVDRRRPAPPMRARASVPYLEEPWYC